MSVATAEPAVRLRLRDYQEDALARVAAAAERGVRRQLGVAATGLGKTVIFASQAQRMGCRALILAHRDELISQAAGKLREVWPGAEVGIVKGSVNDVTAHVVVASVQTLARPQRLDRLVAATNGSTLLGQVEPFGLVVVDEAHHTRADSYGRILDALHAGEPGGPLLLGVTATPDRGDGKALGTVFDEVVFSYDMLFGINAGHLSDLRGVAVELRKFRAADIKVTAGEYNAAAAADLLEQADAPRMIVAAWLEHAVDRRTLVFTPTVAMAVHVADAYRAAGVRADHIDGAMDLTDRRARLDAFHRGDLQVLTNCAVLTEGYDEPRVDCVVIARPTRSRATYTQMVGRGTRRHPDKTDCLVMDLVGATADHHLVTIPSLFGLEKAHRAAAHNGSATMAALVQKQADEHKAAGVLTAREVALFDQVRAEGIAWVHVDLANGLTRYEREMGKGHPTVVLTQVRADDDSSWCAGLVGGKAGTKVLMQNVGMELAQGVAEDWIKHQPASVRRLAEADAKWRKGKPTRKMRDFAKRLRLAVPSDATAGQVADMIDAKLASNKRRKR